MLPTLKALRVYCNFKLVNIIFLFGVPFLYEDVSFGVRTTSEASENSIKLNQQKPFRQIIHNAELIS